MTSTLRTIALAIAFIVAAGCDTGRTNPPDAAVRVIHAAPNTGTAVFKRVKANSTPLDYKGSSSFNFDVDEYSFSFEIYGVDGSVVDTLSFVQTLEEGTDYTMVLREVGGAPAVKIIEAPARQQTSASGTQLQLMHAAPMVGSVDIFIEPEGFDLMTATPWGTLSYDEVLEPREFTGGSYVVVLTAAGDPTTVLMESEPLALGALQNAFLYIADGAGTSVAPVTIAIAEATASDIVDKTVQFGMRVINAVSDRTSKDIGIDLELMPPLIQALPFATVTDTVEVQAGDHNLNVTPAGDMGTIEIDRPFTAPKGALGTWFISGAPGTLNANFLSDEYRVLDGEAKLRCFNAAPLIDGIAIYITAPGTEISTVAPTELLLSGGASANRRLAPGDYELTVVKSSDNTVVAGPLALSIAAGGYYGILINDALSGTGADISLLYDFN